MNLSPAGLAAASFLGCAPADDTGGGGRSGAGTNGISASGSGGLGRAARGPANCSGHGTCDGSTCICNAGFVGPACDACAPNFYSYPACTFCLASSTCNSHGTCSTSGACLCAPGFTGATCQGPAAVPAVPRLGAAILASALLLLGCAGVAAHRARRR